MTATGNTSKKSALPGSKAFAPECSFLDASGMMYWCCVAHKAGVNPPPPMPELNGSVTFNTKLAAIAASTAFPPLCNISAAVWVAQVVAVAMAPACTGLFEDRKIDKNSNIENFLIIIKPLCYLYTIRPVKVSVVKSSI